MHKMKFRGNYVCEKSNEIRILKKKISVQKYKLLNQNKLKKINS